MKTYKPIIFLLFFCLPMAINAQVGDMKSGAKGGGESIGGGGDDWFIVADFVIDFFFAGGYGLFVGFADEPRPNDKTFNDYPYADSFNGLYLPEYENGRLGRLQLLGHFQNNEDDVYGAYGQLKFYPDRFWIIDANHLHLFEPLADQQGVDRLSMTNFNVQINRIHHPKFNFFWGAGLMLLDVDPTYASASLSGGLTWYFKKPLAFHAESQIGWPNGNYARNHQARMQVHLDRFMIYAGYQGTKVGGVGVANWAMGTGVWF